MWMLLVLTYGILKGVREVVKKKALQKNTVMEVLFFYTLLAFIMVLPQARDAMELEWKYLPYIILKSFIIFLAWMCSFMAIKKMPISTYGILDLSRVLFATFLGMTILGEVLSNYQIIGLVLVSAGLLFLPYKSRANRENAQNKEGIRKIYVVAAFASCLLNAVSGLMDKLLMKDITSSQLQFWYMLFLVLFYLGYILIRRIKISRTVWKNGWIWLLSILFVIADKALFIANGMEGSRITIMTLIKQSGCIVTILAGRFIFKEKNIGHKLICAAIIVSGIVIAVL